MSEEVLAPHGRLPEGGTVRPMTRWGTPVMHRPQEPVASYDEALRRARRRHGRDDVRRRRGGPRGLPDRPRTWRCSCSTAPTLTGQRVVGVVCNPVITLPEGKDRELDESDEGCLSLPGAFIACARPDYATVDGFGLDGEPVKYSGDGLLARCLQHETDHTLGTVFGDRLPNKQRKKLLKAHDKVAADFPPTWPVES